MNETGDPIDLVLLQTFHEVARLGSVTGAAKQLGRSQPAVSHRLRALEAELGVPLFEKVGRRLKLTDYGRRLHERCFDLMVMSSRIRAAVGVDAVEGRVTIGALPTVAAHLLVPVMADLTRRFPALGLSFAFGHVAALCDHLRTGRVDALMVLGDVPALDFDVETVGRTDLVAVMSPEDAPRKRGTVRLSELRQLRYLGWEEGPADATFDVIAAFVAKHRLADSYTLRIPHIETLRELAAAGAGYTILPRYTVSAEVKRKRVVALEPVALTTPIDINLVTRRQQLVTPALEEVLARMRRAA